MDASVTNYNTSITALINLCNSSSSTSAQCNTQLNTINTNWTAVDTNATGSGPGPTGKYVTIGNYLQARNENNNKILQLRALQNLYRLKNTVLLSSHLAADQIERDAVQSLYDGLKVGSILAQQIIDILNYERRNF